MSGGRSSSSSTSIDTTATDNSNTQINDTEGLVLNFEGAENSEATIIQSDQGAIRESFSFAESSLDSVGNIATDAFDTVRDTTQDALNFGGDALDQSFDFGNRALDFSNDTVSEAFGFGSDALSEAQDITRNALSIAGNAQTNAFSKIREIAESFTDSGNANTRLILIAIGVGALTLGVFFFLRRK